MSAVESPCVKICKLDEAKSLCIGCYRTVEEIGEWRWATESRQKEILENAADRRPD
ncbi:MAG: DUF1289 domain-containing protein [Kordiimonadaceae bacterium]|nr:DUF1289 domain-containing protein [Kordiimonadaceae bacterium]MBO6570254.1 DUF1289 domain-containing protein [Kordiimonadaceae bacterium]MBO6965648.1 DUF1289 domain-containing protein [Kordiimonadaceae bacterium]